MQFPKGLVTITPEGLGLASGEDSAESRFVSSVISADPGGQGISIDRAVSIAQEITGKDQMGATKFIYGLERQGIVKS